MFIFSNISVCKRNPHIIPSENEDDSGTDTEIQFEGKNIQ